MFLSEYEGVWFIPFMRTELINHDVWFHEPYIMNLTRTFFVFFFFFYEIP